MGPGPETTEDANLSSRTIVPTSGGSETIDDSTARYGPKVGPDWTDVPIVHADRRPTRGLPMPELPPQPPNAEIGSWPSPCAVDEYNIIDGTGECNGADLRG